MRIVKIAFIVTWIFSLFIPVAAHAQILTAITQASSAGGAAPPADISITSGTIASNGTTVTFVFAQAVDYGAGGSGGFVLTSPSATLTYSSGTGTDTIVFTSNVAVYSTDAPSVNYTQPTGGWEQSGGGTQKQSCNSCTTVTNNSTQLAPDSCTAGLLFSWHCEATDVTTAGGAAPGGCSVGDTTATASGTPSLSTAQHEDGEKSCAYLQTFQAGSYAFTWANDIVNQAAGTIDIWIRSATGTPPNNTKYVYLYVDASNYIQLDEFNAIRIRRVAGGTTTTAAAGIAIDDQAWYHVIAKWDVAGNGGNYLQICADTTTGTTNCGTSNQAQGTWAGTSGEFKMPYAGSVANPLYYLDNVKIWDSWK